jgi:DNA-binding transcriptional LysR family regulator
MLDVYELNIFLAAAATENFSKAARQLNLTQPAVSMQVQTLEKKLGVMLFQRTGRNLNLTEQGRALIPLAREMVNRAIRIEEEIESLKGKVVGHLRIGCSTTTGKYFLPQLAARFRRRHPQVQMTIYNHGRESVLAELCEGVVQLAVVSAQPASCRDAEYRHFFTDHMVLIVPASHPWAGREVITAKELCQADFILRDLQSGTRQETEAMLKEVGLSTDDLKVVMEIGNSEAISMAVEEGIGAAFVSRIVARRGIELGKIKEVHVAGLSFEREIYIVYSHRHPATQAQTEFWNFMQEPENEQLLKLAA